MSVTYQSIIDQAETLLQDEDSDQTVRRWKEAELLLWLKYGEREVAKLKADSYPVTETVSLSAGSKQSIPSDAHQLLDVLCNMGTDGSTRGDVVSVVQKKYMNAINPGWMADTANKTVTHVIYDTKRDPRSFWVYPQSPGTNYLEIMSAKLPQNSSKVISDNIMIPDEYDFALIHFVVAMAFMKDTDIPQSAARSQAHMNIFLTLLGKKEMIEETYNPIKHRGSN